MTEKKGGAVHHSVPNLGRIAFLSLTAILMLAVIYMLRDVFHAVVLGALLAFIISPVHKWLLNRLCRLCGIPGNHGEAENKKRHWRCNAAASFMSVLLVFCFVMVPLYFFTAEIIRQSTVTIPKATDWIKEEMPGKVAKFKKAHKDNRAVQFAFDETEHLIQKSGLLKLLEEETDASANEAPLTTEEIQEKRETTQNIMVASSKIGIWLLKGLKNSFTALASQMGWLIFNFFVMLFVMFHFLLDGHNILQYIKGISPLHQETQNLIIQRIKDVSKAIFLGIFGTAAIQGLVAMVIFRIAGVPALFWGFMLGIASIIPFVGTGLIWLPMTIYFILLKQYGTAAFIFIACGLIVANVDSLVRPLLMKKGGNTGMSYMVLFFALLGGLRTFGLAGLIYGPLIMGISGICLLIFSTHYKKQHCEPNGN